MTLIRKILPVFALAFPSTAAAEAPLPKPIAELECLTGSWKASGTFSDGKQKTPVNATWNCRRTSAKYGVSCNLVLTGIPGVPRFEETDLFGWEPNTNLYHWYSVTNGGETHDHVAKLPANNAVQFVFNGTLEGKPFKEVIDLKFADDSRSFNLRSETFLDAASTSVLEIVAKK